MLSWQVATMMLYVLYLVHWPHNSFCINQCMHRTSTVQQIPSMHGEAYMIELKNWRFVHGAASWLMQSS